MPQRPQPVTSEDGFSLIEVLVSITILSVVLTGVFLATLTIERTARETQQQNIALGDARIAIDTMSKHLRSAIQPEQDRSAFMLATSNRVLFCANLNRATGAPWPLQMEYYFDGTDLRESTLAPGTNQTQDCTLNDGAVTDRVIARGLTSTNIFRFYGDITDPEAAAADPGAAELVPPLASDDLRSIRSVGMTLSLLENPDAQVNPTEVESRIRLANLDDVIIERE